MMVGMRFVTFAVILMLYLAGCGGGFSGDNDEAGRMGPAIFGVDSTSARE